MQVLTVIPRTTALEWVKTGNDSAVFYLTALGRVGELALTVRSWTGSSLEFSTNLQRQPLCVPHLCHIYRHLEPGRKGRSIEIDIQQMQLCLCLFFSIDSGTNIEKEEVKDMGKCYFKRFFVPKVWFWGEDLGIVYHLRPIPRVFVLLY